MEWISVEGRLPETGFGPAFTCSLHCLIWSDECETSEDTMVGYYSEYGGWKSQDLAIGEQVTHWMSLPEPPEKPAKKEDKNT